MSTRSQYPHLQPFLLTRYPLLCFITDHRFLKDRRYEFDVALKCCKLAIEIEGGATFGKGHRGIGNFLSDMNKYNLAAINGWRLIRVTPEDVSEKNLTKGKLTDILDTYFLNNPCPHLELNDSLRLLYVK